MSLNQVSKQKFTKGKHRQGHCKDIAVWRAGERGIGNEMWCATSWDQRANSEDWQSFLHSRVCVHACVCVCLYM